MPIIQSAKKRVKVAAKANDRNVKTRRTLRDALKAFDKAVAGGKAAQISKAEKATVSALDIAVKKDVLHRNKAARQKAQLSARAKAAGAKPVKSAAKAPVKKAAPKKPAAKATAKK